MQEKIIDSFVYINGEEIDGEAYFNYSIYQEEIEFNFKYFITKDLQKFDASQIEDSCLHRLEQRFLESF
jgi:hypothetical protein